MDHTMDAPTTVANHVNGFCREHGISRAHFYNLLKRGDGPAIMKVGRRTLISAEAAAEWRRRMEALANARTIRGGKQP
jgi:predicted DNA-binding transcriptional regulator AlpA